GSTGTGEQFLRISGWREQADAPGLVAVFPTGLRYRVLDSGRLSTKWNDYSLASQVDLSERPRGYPANAPWPANDGGFVDAVDGRPGGAAAHRPPPRLRIRLLQRRGVRRAPGGGAFDRAGGGRVLRRRPA